PVFAFYLPIYAFWHFDDFSWGNTRMVVGERGKKKLVADEGKFDPKSIPKKKWSDYEQELWEVNSEESVQTRVSDKSYRSHTSKKAGSVAGSKFGSAYGDFHEEYGQRARSRSPAPRYTGDDRRTSRALSNVASQHPGDYTSQRGSQYLSSRAGEYEYFGGNSRPVSTAEGGHYARDIVPAEPSDDEILQEIRSILSAANLMTVTKKQVRDELSMRFGFDMNSKKEY